MTRGRGRGGHPEQHTDAPNWPLPWLTQLVRTSKDAPTKLAIFRSSRAFRDLVLCTSSTVICRFNTEADPGASKAVRSLRRIRTCTDAAEVHMHLQGSKQPSLLTLWLSALCASIKETVQASPLHLITRVELQGEVLGGLVPLCLIQACPNLQRLTRGHNILQCPSPSSPVPPCAQLTHLTITRSLVTHYSTPPPDRDDGLISAQQMQQQVQGLPGLTSLAFTVTDFDVMQDGTEECWTGALAALSTQLTSLEVPVPESGGSFPISTIASATWPQLRRLHLLQRGGLDHTTLVSDRVIEALLQHTPQLEELHVGVLHGVTDFSNRPCKWQRVHIDYPSVADLARLPLSQQTSFSMRALAVRRDDEAHVAAAAARLGACREVHTQPNDTLVLDAGLDPRADLPPLLPLMPLLTHLRRPIVHLRAYGCSEEPVLDDDYWVSAMAQLGCSTLKVGPAMMPAKCASFVAQLPQLQELQLENRGQPTPGLCDKLLALCIYAHRPFCLTVEDGLADELPEHWQEHLKLAMEAAKHQHVKIGVWW